MGSIILLDYRDLFLYQKKMYAEHFWDILNVSYTNGTDEFKTPMSFWMKQIEKIQEDYDIIPNNIDISNKYSRSIFDILHKRLNKFKKGIKIGKVYTYDIINETVIEP